MMIMQPTGCVNGNGKLIQSACSGFGCLGVDAEGLNQPSRAAVAVGSVGTPAFAAIFRRRRETSVKITGKSGALPGAENLQSRFCRPWPAPVKLSAPIGTPHSALAG
jgi:hypothetical protein